MFLASVPRYEDRDDDDNSGEKHPNSEEISGDPTQLAQLLGVKIEDRRGAS